MSAARRSRKLGGEVRRVESRRCAAGIRARPRRAGPARSGRGETARPGSRPPRGALRSARAPSAASSQVPGVQRVARLPLRPRTRARSALRCARARPKRAPLLGARGPQRRHEAVEVGAAGGGRALDQGQPVGHEDGDGRAASPRLGAGAAGAVEQMAAAFVACEIEARNVRRSAPSATVASARASDSPKRIRSRARSGPAGAPGEGEVERLEQVGLAGAVGAVTPSGSSRASDSPR